MMKFTSDWFSNNIPRWEKFLKPALAKLKNPRILDIAPYEGRSTLWLLENIPGCHVTILQPLKDKRVLKRFHENIAGYIDRVHVLNGGVELLKNIGSFDFVYIDIVGVDSRGTLEAAVTTFPLLKPGGMMAFDDYTTDRRHGYVCPKPAIDAFTDIYSRYIKVFHASWQLLLVKRRRPLPTDACKSEYYHEDLRSI